MKVPKRRGIGWSIIVFVFGMFIFGIIWAVLYYGALLPIATSFPTAYPTAFDATSLAFVTTFIGWWPFIVLLGYLLWLWQQSNRSRPSY